MARLLGKALAGAGAAVQPVALEAMRAEIMAQRDARMNEYAKSAAATGREFTAGETEKKIGAEKDTALIKARSSASEKGRITQLTGIKDVLQPRYGGKFEGGVWFPDEKNRDVALRAQEIYEQLTQGRNGGFIEAATRAAEQAEREAATGKLPIGRPPSNPGGGSAGGGAKSFRHLWNDSGE